MSVGQPAIKQIQSPAIWSPRFYLGMAGLVAVDHLVASSRGPESHILKDIWVDLKRGLLCATGDVSEETLAEQEAATVWERRDFFWEGYAVGLRGVHALTFSRGNPERRSRRRTGFRGMLYTGYGYWNGVAAWYFLPRLSMDPKAWSDIPDFAQFLPIEIGGEAFTRVMLERQITAEFFRSFEQNLDPISTLAAWHGCGRALWIRWTGDFEKLGSLVQCYPPARPALALGLGIAIAFTQVGSPDRVIRAVQHLPAAIQRSVTWGCATALALKVDQNRAESDRIYTLYSGDLLRFMDEVLRVHAEAQSAVAASGEGWYGKFMACLDALQSRAEG